MDSFQRTLELDCARADASARTVPATIATTYPVNRAAYIEVLDCSPAAIDLSRAPLPVIESHDANTVNIGVVDNLVADGNRLRGNIRFGKSQRANEILADIQDGVITSVSVGYRVEGWQERGDTQVATRWTPHEVSIVSVPADPNAGFYRSRNHMDTQTTETETRDASRAELSGIALDSAGNERTRITEIQALASRHSMGKIGSEHVAKGTAIDLFKGIVLEELGRRGSNKPLTQMAGDLDLSVREKKQYSLSRTILSRADAILGGRSREASFEYELSEEIGKRCGREPRGIFVPYDVMTRQAPGDGPPSMFTRVLTSSGGVATGGAVVQSTVLASEYIPPNYNIPVVVEAGARVLPGLTGNVLIPKMTAGKSGTWVTPENTAVGSADATFAQVALNPKDFGTVGDISRRLLLQANPAVDGLVRDDIATAIQIGLDAAALVGTGASGQPLGVTGQAGVQTQAGGANGLALTWSNLTYLLQLVGAANRLNAPGLGFITNIQAFAHAARTPKVANYPVFLAEYAQNQGLGIGARAGNIFGMPAHISQQVPSNLVKGSSGAICSAMYFGAWSDLLIGEWGVMDMLVDPYTFSNTGAIRIRCFITVDIAVRYGASFAQLTDIITT